MIFAVRTAIGFSFRLEVALYEPFIDDIMIFGRFVLSFGLGVLWSWKSGRFDYWRGAAGVYFSSTAKPRPKIIKIRSTNFTRKRSKSGYNDYFPFHTPN